ncbi:hypothetical protein [Streptomyces sp. YIM S03343]
MRRSARLLASAALALGAGGLAAGIAYGVHGQVLELVPSTAVPGDEVTARTTDCPDRGKATGDASAVGGGAFTLAPSPGGTGAAGRFRVPESAQPGTYEIVAQCAGGKQEVSGDLVVSLTPPPSPEPTHSAGGGLPHGSVKTGVGGAFGTDPVQTAAGLAALAVAAAGGTWLLHRRARGDGI